MVPARHKPINPRIVVFLLFLILNISSILAFAVSNDDNDDNKARDSSSDTEVYLTTNPMISPDIVIGKFTDSKVILHDRIIEASNYLNSQLNSTTPRPVPIVDNNVNEVDEEANQEDTQSDETMDMLESYDENESQSQDQDQDQHDQIFDPDNEEGIGHLFSKDDDEKDMVIVKKPRNGAECHVKMNATSGTFQMNFNDDCTVLVSTPMVKARVILHCENMKLPACNKNKDVLTVNLKGDMKFGRNSYLYCGDSQIRTTSIERQISIRIKSTPGVTSTVKCHFFGRQQRIFIPKSGDQLNTLCGKLGRSSKIVGGKKVPPGLFPWAAQLDISRVDGSQTACTGSLVSDRYVLTAAHCLKNAESISVFMGGADRLEFTGTEVAIQAEKYILHRRWNPKSLTADIALVKLSEPVKYTEEVSPICLQEPESLLGLGLIRRESWAGKTGVSVGWGRLTTKETAPRKLYRVKLPFLSDVRCGSIYSAYFQKRTMLCTDSNEQAAICYGDSGGPLMYKRKDIVYQVGVASFSLSRKCGESPDVFTKVSEYASWIKTRIKADT